MVNHTSSISSSSTSPLPNRVPSPSQSSASSSLERIHPLTRGLVEAPGIANGVQNSPGAASNSRNLNRVNRASLDHSETPSLRDELKALINQKVVPMYDTFSGKMVLDIPHGKGKMKYRNEQGDVAFEYEGHFKYGKRYGHGRETYLNGSFREVQYTEDERHSGGDARIILSNHSYTGQLTVAGRFYRDVFITYPESDRKESYKGQLNVDLQPQGNGTLKYRNGDFFQGRFRNGQPYGIGRGRVTLPGMKIHIGLLNDKLEPLEAPTPMSAQPSKEQEAGPVNAGTISKRKRDSEELNEHLCQPQFKTARLLTGLSPIQPQQALENMKVYEDGRVYEGQSMNGLPHGFGRMRYPDGIIHEGLFEQGMRHGFGRICFSNGVHHVICEQDRIIKGGFARSTLNGFLYYGSMNLDAQFVGNITIIYPAEDSREMYCGTLNNNLEPSGQGKMKFRNGDVFEGTFADGNFVSSQQSDYDDIVFEHTGSPFYLDLDDPLFANIDRESQELTNSSDSNDGRFEVSFESSQTVMNTTRPKTKVSFPKEKIEFSDGRVYEGESMDGLPHGVGRMHYPDGSIFTGPFNQGNRHGRGRILFPNGNGWRQVVYEQDQLVRGGYAQVIINKSRYVGFMSQNDQSFKPSSIIFPKGDVREWYRGSMNSELEPHGTGKMKFLNGITVEGEFANGWPVSDRQSVQRPEPSPSLDSSNSNHSEPYQTSNSDTDSGILAASSPTPTYSVFPDSPFFDGLSSEWPDSFNLPDDFN